MPTKTITLPNEEKIDDVSANLVDAGLVAQAGVAQVIDIAEGRFELEEPPTSQLGVLHVLATDLEHEGKRMMTAAHRLRDALVALDGMRREGASAAVTEDEGDD